MEGGGRDDTEVLTADSPHVSEDASEASAFVQPVISFGQEMDMSPIMSTKHLITINTV